MSQPISIVHQTEDGFTEFGATSHGSESYIKLSTSLRKSGLIQSLRGSRLHVFIMIALHEADDQPGASLHTLQAELGISTPTIIDSLKFLTDSAHPFVKHVGYEKDGTKRYRPCSLAWHGKDPSGQGSKETLQPKKNFSLDDDVDPNKLDHSDLNSSTSNKHHAETRKIFSSVRIGGGNLSKLAEQVAPELAHRWARWIRWAEQNAREDYSNPVGLCIYCLIGEDGDPATEPPDDIDAIEREQKERAELAAQNIAETKSYNAQCDAENDLERAARERTQAEFLAQFQITRGELNAAFVWSATVGELQLQMSKATFDTWVRPTRVLGWRGDELCVAVHSPYAKEWLENRLSATVQRALVGIMGASVPVDYIYQDKRS